MVLLENVRNIAGPRHAHEWAVIIRSLRDLGYRVSSKPIVFSPHLLPPERGGRPQVRERVFIMGTYVGKQAAQLDVEPAVPHAPVDDWSPAQWSLAEDLPLQSDEQIPERLRLNLTPAETTWAEAWNDFVVTLRARGVERLPGFPVWKDAFVHVDDLLIEEGTPAWKANFLRKNADFYTRHQDLLESWLERWDYLDDFPASRRKFEWQAQDAARWTTRSFTCGPPAFASSGRPTSRLWWPSHKQASWATGAAGWHPERLRDYRGSRSGSISAGSPTPQPTSRWGTV